MVYVSGYKMVKEALVTKGENFARCVTPLFDQIYKGRGKTDHTFNNTFSRKV